MKHGSENATFPRYSRPKDRKTRFPYPKMYGKSISVKNSVSLGNDSPSCLEQTFKWDMGLKMRRFHVIRVPKSEKGIFRIQKCMEKVTK